MIINDVYDMELRPLGSNRFELVSDYFYNGIKVPKGFITDGATVPRWFWIVVPPFKPRHLPAVIIHDYLIDKGEIAIGNKLFRELLLNLEDTWKTRLMVTAVDWYWKYYKRVEVSNAK